MSTRNLLQTINTGSIASDYLSSEIDLDQSLGFCVVSSAVVEAVVDKTFTSSDVALSTITIANHGYAFGLKVRFTTTGVLPSGLSAGVDYYLTNLTTSTLLVSSSIANLNAGSYVTLADGGSGTHTIDVQSALTPYVEFYGSIDDENYFLVPNSRKELSEDLFPIEYQAAFFHKLKVKIAVPSGQFTVNCKIMVKGKLN